MITKSYRVAGVNITHWATNNRTSNSVCYITLDSDGTFQAWGMRKPEFKGNDKFWVFRDFVNCSKPLGEITCEINIHQIENLPKPEELIWTVEEARNNLNVWLRIDHNKGLG